MTTDPDRTLTEPTSPIEHRVADAPEVGEIIGGRFEVERPLDGSHHAFVSAATDLTLDRPVAVKLFASRAAPGRPSYERFLRESKVTAKLLHPNIVRVYELGTHKERPFIVMELLEGQNLRQRLIRGGPVAVDEACRIVRQLLLGLRATHAAEIVHRDVKPSNVFLADVEGSEHPVVKLLDFGISRTIGRGAQTRLTDDDQILGTPTYLAPEQLLGKELDFRVDLYAVGVLVYRLLTGARPFGPPDGEIFDRIIEGNPEPPSSSRAGLPPDVDAFVLKALAVDPDDRFQTADAMLDACRLVSLFAEYVTD